MRRTTLLVFALALALSLVSMGGIGPTRADDAPPSTPCLESTPDGTPVGTPDGTGTPDAASTEVVSYTGILSQSGDDIILTTVDGDEIVVAPSGAFAPGQLDLTLTYEITGTETPDGTLKAMSIVVVEIATATPEATPEGTPEPSPEATATPDGTPEATLEPTLEPTSDGCDNEGSAGHKVQVCHLPGGDINKARTLTIGAPALPAHLGHGDTAGPCAKEGKPGGGKGKPGNKGNGKGGGKGKP